MEIADLVTCARDEGAPEAERHRAFAELVRRFEDLAFACAYARLRDVALAEDAAQDAFLLGWTRLHQLRDPAAFAGWIRRLVLTQCHRRLRGRRLEIVPGPETPDDPRAGHDLEAEDADQATVVRRALLRLAAGDRLVLILAYGSERSHAEIAEWLRVPITTIARRIAHAKRRLRRHALDGFAGGLRRERQASGEAFVVEFNARLRRSGPQDAGGIAMLAARLGLDRAPRIAPAAPRSAYVVDDPETGRPVAFASAVQTIFRPIHDLQIAIEEEALRRHVGDVLLTQIVHDAIASDAIALQHRTSARHSALLAFLRARGFEIVERWQDWRLAPAAAVPRGELPPGMSVRPLSALSEDAILFDQTLALLTEAAAGSPAERAFLPIPPEALRRGLRPARAGVLALTGGELHGLLAASADDLLPDAARIDMLLVRASHRGRGVATAMLAHLLRNGWNGARLLTPAGPELAGWLARRAFTQSPDAVLLERLLRKVVTPAPRVLDAYVGCYVADAMPDAPIVIERYADTLISKARDMRDVLLASSDTEFFTRHHYGRGRFERDASGRVSGLVYTEGPHEMIARRV